MPRPTVPAILCVLLSAVLAGCSLGPQTGPTDTAPPMPGVTRLPPVTPGPQQLTITLSGDLLWHGGLLADAAAAGRAAGHAYDFEPVLSRVKPIIEAADVSVCHLEVPVAPPGVEPSGYPTFGAPAETIQAVAATGFDYCTTASNHAYDRGRAGLEATLAELDEHRIAHTGTYATREASVQPTLLTTEDGVRVAVVAGTYDVNGGGPGAARAWSIDPLDAGAMVARGEAARSAGADVVLASMHAGIEYQLLPSKEQVAVATELATSGVFDVVYGHHAHVPQPWTRIAGTWVIYGGGNLVAQMRLNTPRAYDAYLGRLTLERRGDRFEVVLAEYVPLLMTLSRPGAPARVLPVVEAMKDGQGDTERLEVARRRVREAVLALDATGLTES